jgi:competence protein ComEC
LGPFGLAEPALQVMASALDLIAAVGATFGGRPEALRAMAMPPHAAFVLCVFAMLWGCLWRGGLRWLALAPFAASLALYVDAPRPVAAFDADLRAFYIHVGGEGEPWRLLAGRGRSTYARDRLGGMLGIAPPRAARLSPPETCNEAFCQFETPLGGDVRLVRDVDAFDAACAPRAIVISRHPAPPDFAVRCRVEALIDAASLAAEGGAYLYETATGFSITRATPPGQRRPWTQHMSPDQPQE